MKNVDKNLILYLIAGIAFCLASVFTEDIFWTFVGVCFWISAFGYIRKGTRRNKRMLRI